ncbi:gag protein, partial [Colletotrichum chrysophilum]
MSTNTASSKKVLLRTFEDWGRWDEEFQTKSISLHLWDCINPDGEEALMEKPQRPAFETYNRKVTSRAADLDHLSQQGRQTRHGGQSTQTVSQSSTGDLALSTTESTDPHLRARNLSELTAEDKASFTFEWRVYEQDYKEYKEQETNSERLKAWVIDTVDYGLRQSSCRAMWDLRTWYANLRTSVGATEREQQTAARRKYQTATKILSSVPKDFAGWITSWEMATNHALVRKTGGVEDPNTWFEDLTRAIQPIFGGWVTIYAGIYKDKLEEKTLTIGEVAKDLRKEA